MGLGFCVVLRDADPKDVLRPDQLRALAGIGAHVVGFADVPPGDLVVDAEGKYGAFLDAHGEAAMITRPDFYVFGGASPIKTWRGWWTSYWPSLRRTASAFPPTWSTMPGGSRRTNQRPDPGCRRSAGRLHTLRWRPNGLGKSIHKDVPYGAGALMPDLQVEGLEGGWQGTHASV